MLCCIIIWLFTLVRSQYYSHLHYDRLNRISDWYSDGDISVVSSSKCPSTSNDRLNALSTLNIHQQSKICLSNAYNSEWDGEYKWQYYNSDINGSIYYNIDSNKYIYPFITSWGDYRYYIHNDETNTMTNARCSLSNHSKGYIFDVSDCIGIWELYYNNTWNLHTNMIATPCQDICINGNDKSFIVENATFVFLENNATRKTNIYYCTSCKPLSDGSNIYLFGWIDESGDYEWIIGRDYNTAFGWSRCYIGNNLGNGYIFNINDCLYWKTYNGDEWVDDINMIPSHCNAEPAKEICVKLESNAQLSRTYSINESYQGFAIGFDLNVVSVDIKDRLVIECWCGDGTNITYIELTEFNYDSRDITVTGIIYSLPKRECDDSLSISIKFIVDSTVSSDLFYLDNVYLYYGVDDIIFSDEMKNGANWLESSDTAITGYKSDSFCPSDGECYRFNTISSVESVAIITLNNAYKYKDFNLKWSLKTNDFLDNTIFNVAVQCDDDIYVNDSCILKQYNFKNECIDNSCNIQSYNLPYNSCDYSSEIQIKFYMQSTSETNNVYIDYVYLTHSDSSGNDPEKCIYIHMHPTTNTLNRTPQIVVYYSGGIIYGLFILIIFTWFAYLGYNDKKEHDVKKQTWLHVDNQKKQNKKDLYSHESKTEGKQERLDEIEMHHLTMNEEEKEQK